MKYDKWIQNWKSALAENFFLRMALLLALFALLVNGAFKKPERIVVMPPHVDKKMSIDQDKASPEYIESMASFFAAFGGNISPTNADYVAKVISEYAVNDSSASKLREDLAVQAKFIKQNHMEQSFYPDAIHLDDDGKSAFIKGLIKRSIGSASPQTEQAIFHIKFAIKDTQLKIEDYYIEYPDRKHKEVDNVVQTQTPKK